MVNTPDVVELPGCAGTRFDQVLTLRCHRALIHINLISLIQRPCTLFPWRYHTTNKGW